MTPWGGGAGRGELGTTEDGRQRLQRPVATATAAWQGRDGIWWRQKGKGGREASARGYIHPHRAMRGGAAVPRHAWRRGGACHIS